MHTNEREFSVLWLLRMAGSGVIRHLTMAATKNSCCMNLLKFAFGVSFNSVDI